MFKRIGIGLIALVALLGANVGSAHAQAAYADHCSTGLKQTIDFNQSSATTTSLIAPVTGANIYICGVTLNQAGGVGTVSFEMGTGATCGTGTIVLAGPYTANTTAGTTTQITISNNGNTQIDTTTASALLPSQRFCIVSTGTIVQSGHLVYVQE
jgi:hypothetical protein